MLQQGLRCRGRFSWPGLVPSAMKFLSSLVISSFRRCGAVAGSKVRTLHRLERGVPKKSFRARPLGRAGDRWHSRSCCEPCLQDHWADRTASLLLSHGQPARGQVRSHVNQVAAARPRPRLSQNQNSSLPGMIRLENCHALVTWYSCIRYGCNITLFACCVAFLLQCSLPA